MSELTREQVERECQWLVEEHCGSAARKWLGTDAALRARVAELDRRNTILEEYQLKTGNLEEQLAETIKQMEQAQQQLATVTAERDATERERIEWVQRAERAESLNDALRAELAALSLTWTTARPTVAGGYWVKRIFDGESTYNVMDVDEHGAIGPYRKPLEECDGWEFAGPIPMPKEKA